MGARFAVLEQFIQEKMAETRLPAVSIALVERGETVYQRGFGFRDSARGLPATPRTLYGIGSVTKSFTCLAIMQLQEQGKLTTGKTLDYAKGLVVGEYRVNADAVARAMLSKLRLACLSHRVLGIRRDLAVAPARPSAHA